MKLTKEEKEARRKKHEKLQKPGCVKGGKYTWDEEESKDGR